MRVLGRIGCLVMLPALSAIFPGASAEPAPTATKGRPPVMAQALPSEGDIILFQSSQRLLVMMRIGDGELVPMVFDTGSDGHSIDRLLVTRNRLKKIGTTTEIDGTTKKERELPIVRINDVTLGGLKVGRIEASALDYDRNDAMGIISTEMFTSSLIYLDLANNRARLVPREGAVPPIEVPTPYDGPIPAADVILPDGTKLLGHLDTGSNAALRLPTTMMDKVPLMAPARVVGRWKSINSEGEVYGGQIRGQIRVGNVTLDNPKVQFLGDHANIGLPIIRQMTLVLDPSENRSWVLAPGAVPVRAK